jgi:hypothetical protein
VTVAGAGVGVRAPRGWDVAIFQRNATPPETTHAVVHAATFALPSDRGDYGDGAVQLMSATDVFVALVEFEPSSTATALFASRGFPPPLRGDDFSRASLQVSIGGHAGTQRWFTDQARAWCLYVVLGSWDHRAALVGRANELIAGIEVRA